MGKAERITVTLMGGAPWGFRLTGGGALPLTINNIRKKSMAANLGLRMGDAVLSINGVPVHDKTQDEAIAMCEKSGRTLKLEIFRGDISLVGDVPVAVPETKRSWKKREVVTETTSTSLPAETLLVSRSQEETASQGHPVQPSGEQVPQVQVSTTTFDDGQTRTEVTRQQQVATNDDGRSTTITTQESTSTISTQRVPGLNEEAMSSSTKQSSVITTTSKQVPPNPQQPSKYQPVSFTAPKLQEPQEQPKQQIKFTPIPPQPKYEPASKQAPPIYQQPPPQQQPPKQQPPPSLQQQPMAMAVSSLVQAPPSQQQQPSQQPRPQPPTTISPVMSLNSQNKVVPSFNPSKFVPGGSNKDIPGLYPLYPMPGLPEGRPQEHQEFKENVAPLRPMFQVRNIKAQTGRAMRDSFKPNMWMDGQKPKSRQPSRGVSPTSTYVDDSLSYADYPETYPVPQPQKIQKLTIAERKKQLMNQPISPRKSNYFGDNAPDGHHEIDYDGTVRTNRTHLFAPPVEIHARSGDDMDYDVYSMGGTKISEPGENEEYYYEEVEAVSSPESTLKRQHRNMYSDSAFYDTKEKKFPTIEEQRKLCKTIAQSLTSAANRRARGATMFLRRKKKSGKWVHDSRGPHGEYGDFASSQGDVANIYELESELDHDEGGSKPLFYFKIPNLKTKVQGGKPTKMALSQDQFERLRLTAKKCDHRQLAPEASFDIAHALKNHKGRGGRLFEKRKARTDKFITDESSLHGGLPQQRLENVLSAPIAQKETPWEAVAHHGTVDPAFAHLDEWERNLKLNAMLKISHRNPEKVLPAVPVEIPAPPVVRSNLKGSGGAHLDGKDFNRLAKGWTGGGEYPVADSHQHVNLPQNLRWRPMYQTDQLSHVPAPGMPDDEFGNYNNKIKAWQAPGHTPYAQRSQPSQAPYTAQTVPGGTAYQPVKPGLPYSAPAPQDNSWNYRAQPEWQTHDPEVQEFTSLTGSAYRDHRLSHQELKAPKYEKNARPGSQHFAAPSYHENVPGAQYKDSGVQYKEPQQYTYLPVDTGFNPGDLSSNTGFSAPDYSSQPMYMQPIIPGTDL